MTLLLRQIDEPPATRSCHRSGAMDAMSDGWNMLHARRLDGAFAQQGRML
jgi:hypothetical protein